MRDGSAGWPPDARHCLRLGVMNDKLIVERAQESFDVLVIQANLAISTARGLGSWHALDKPFWIDPITYAFVAATAYLKSEQKIRRGEPETRLQFKRTFQALADAYGEPFGRVIAEDRPLVPEEFAPERDRELVERLLDWQRTVLAPPAEDIKYGLPEALEPVLLTVPFFPLEQFPRALGRPRWMDVNIRLVQAALESDRFDPGRLAVGLLVEDVLFDEWEQFDWIYNAYLDLPVRHLWFWISDNEEVDEMSAARAQRLREVVQRAVDRGKALHQAFGGSFSALLLSDGLASVGHGVNYWEHKTWEPIAGGGVPPLRYFYPPLRRRLPFLDADAVVPDDVATAEDFHREICGCATCRDALDGSIENFARYGQVELRSRLDRFGNRITYNVPLPESLVLTKLHYLRAKRREVAETTGDDFDPRATLEWAIERYDGRPVSVRPLRHWLIAFSDAA